MLVEDAVKLGVVAIFVVCGALAVQFIRESVQKRDIKLVFWALFSVVLGGAFIFFLVTITTGTIRNPFELLIDLLADFFEF